MTSFSISLALLPFDLLDEFVLLEKGILLDGVLPPPDILSCLSASVSSQNQNHARSRDTRGPSDTQLCFWYLW